MVRSLLISLISAILVVSAFVLLQPGLFVTQGGDAGETGSPGPGAAPGTTAAEASGSGEVPAPPAGAEGTAPEGGDLEVRQAPPPRSLEDLGRVARGYNSLQKAVAGFTPLEINRSRRKLLTEAIYAIETAYKEDPRPEVIDLLVERFKQSEDPGLRYGMTWLFRRIPDDRMVEPLAAAMDEMPLVVTDTLADLGSEKALRTLARLAPSIEDPGIRSQAYIRLGRSALPDAEIFLEKVYRDPQARPRERMTAMLALGHRSPEESLHRALEVALGPPVPLEGLEDPAGHFPVHDLRQAAAMSVMRQGSQDAARRLLTEAETRGEEDFARIVDHALMAYGGPDITALLLERIRRRGTVGFGEASYLLRHAGEEDLDHLRELEALADSDRTLRTLQAARRRLVRGR